MTEPTVRQRTDIPEDNIKRESSEKITVYEWYCSNCEEWIGWPELGDSPAVICDDASECPHSVEWDGDACGHVVCKWCHEPASDRTRTYEQSTL